MGGFFKTFWAALLAFIVANVIVGVLGVLFFSVVMMAAMSRTPSAKLDSNTVLEICLDMPIKDSPAVSVSGIDLLIKKKNLHMSLLDVISAIDRASVDPKIAGIFLNTTEALPLGAATRGEIRDALVRFKESGKFIISYSDTYSQGEYHLCSVADYVYLNPEGLVEWRGLSSNVMFFKGLFDKLGVQPEIIRHGKFKSAVEPLISDRMSPESRLQLTTLLGDIWGRMVGEVAVSKDIDSAALQSYASRLSVRKAADAVERKMVDSLVYYDQVMEILGSFTDEDADDVKTISLSDYILYSQSHRSKKVSKNQIALIYAEGDIALGSGEQREVGSESLRVKLAKAKEDDDIKAVVLRVNSPGGSALASEVIWRAMEQLRQEKPVIVSMGNCAASGGYYISVPSDVIVASPYTITGSIGVFGVMFNLQKGMRDKLGITVDVAKTNPSADITTPFRAFTPAEKQYVQDGVEAVYKTFVAHVAQGRNMSIGAVDSVGQGRVWSGVSAGNVGLIDGFGGISDAVSLAADRAGVAEDFRVSVMTDPEDVFRQIVRMLSAEARAAAVSPELRGIVEDYQHVMTVLGRDGVQAAMPYTIDIQ